MATARYDMTICQGSDYTLKLTLKNSLGIGRDLTGYTFTGQIRKTASDPVVQASFSFVIADQVTNTGELEVKLAASDSSAILLDNSKSATRKTTTMTYDIESEDGAGVKKRELEGLVKISPEVTK